jgi:lysine biosynthesis protein LysW
MWACEECGAEFSVPEDAEEGELVACPVCAVEYEVVATDPPELVIFEEDEK